MKYRTPDCQYIRMTLFADLLHVQITFVKTYFYVVTTSGTKSGYICLEYFFKRWPFIEKVVLSLHLRIASFVTTIQQAVRISSAHITGMSKFSPE